MPFVPAGFYHCPFVPAGFYHCPECQRRSSSLFDSRVFCLKTNSGSMIFVAISVSSPYYHAFIPVDFNHYPRIFCLLEIPSFSHPLHHSTVLFFKP